MIARFVRGANTLDIATAPYSLGDDFLPPAANMTYNLAPGTAANVYGGAKLVSEKANNVDLNFSIRIIGPTGTSSNSYINHMARRVVQFVKAKSTDALYFEWEANSLPEPLWGQFGAPKRYEIVTIDVSMGQEYQDPVLRTSGVNVHVTTSIKPFAYGKKQWLCQASGGVWLDTIGSADGQAWGLRIPEATTNKMTNPVFSHPTWNTGWTNAAAIVEHQKRDPNFVFPGSVRSAYLISTSTTNNTYTQSINVGNTNKHSFSAIVARDDGAPVTSADCVIYYNAAQTTTFRHLGNGIYLAYTDNIDGRNSATLTGIQVKQNHSVYLMAFQCEEKAYHTPICFGDMLGCTWSGTVAESTSARTEANVTNPCVTMADLGVVTRNYIPWSIHCVWIPDYASTASGDRYMFSSDPALNTTCYFNATDDKFYFADPTQNTASTAAVTFSAGDVIEVICSIGYSGLAIYVKNHTAGTSYSGTNATVDITGWLLTDYYIGKDISSFAGGIFQLFDTYDFELTSAQASAIQAATAAIIATGQKLGDIPCLYDYDNTNRLDGTGKNYAVALGIPGNVPARTVINGLASSSNPDCLWLSNFDVDNFISPAYSTYSDQSGTVDANSVGGEYYAQSVNTTVVAFSKTITSQNAIRELMGRSGIYLARFADAGANLYFGGAATWGGTVTGYYHGVTSSATYYLWNTYQVTIFDKSYLFDGLTYLTSATLKVNLYRTADGAANVSLDYFAFLPRPVMKLTSVSPGFIYDSEVNHVTSESAAGVVNSMGIPMYGDKIEFVPGKYNILSMFLGDGTHAPTITYTMTYRKVFVTPRWSLL